MKSLKNQLYSFFRYRFRTERAKELYNILENANFDEVTQQKPTKIDNIAFVMPCIDPTSGGGSSILRIGTFFSSKGANVYYICYNEDDIEKLQKNAEFNVKNFKGKYLTTNDSRKYNFDFVIATMWESVYFAKNIPGYKIYFVQDYEPYFSAKGDEYILAERTYELGLHVVSLGQWNLQQIRKHTQQNIKMDYIDFPYEPNEYLPVKRNYNAYKARKHFKICVYIKASGRRIPYIIQFMLSKATAELMEQGIHLDICFYGLNKKEKVLVGENLGRLSKQQLNSLYQECDFGMVASITNISLVPYEMLATGLPLFEFKCGSYSTFLGEDTSILLDIDYRDFIEKFLNCINNTEILETNHSNAINKINNLSWNQTCEQFWKILNNCLV